MATHRQQAQARHPRRAQRYYDAHGITWRSTVMRHHRDGSITVCATFAQRDGCGVPGYLGENVRLLPLDLRRVP